MYNDESLVHPFVQGLPSHLQAHCINWIRSRLAEDVPLRTTLDDLVKKLTLNAIAWSVRPQGAVTKRLGHTVVPQEQEVGAISNRHLWSGHSSYRGNGFKPWNSTYRGGYRGRGRGGFKKFDNSHRGFGKPRYSQTAPSLVGIRCHKCGKMGHFRRDCRLSKSRQDA